MSERLLTIHDIAGPRIPRGKSAIYDDIAKGKFPKPIKYGGKNVWPESQIDAHIRGIIAAASEAEAA